MGKLRDLIRGFTSEVLIRHDTSARGIWKSGMNWHYPPSGIKQLSIAQGCRRTAQNEIYDVWSCFPGSTNYDTQCRGASFGGEDFGHDLEPCFLALLTLVRSSGVVPGLLACGSVLRANHWAKPRISSRATKASQLVSSLLFCGWRKAQPPGLRRRSPPLQQRADFIT